MSRDGDRAGNWWVFPGFEIEVVASGLDLPCNIAFVPEPTEDPDDPLFYITELYGNVKVVTNDWQVSAGRPAGRRTPPNPAPG